MKAMQALAAVMLLGCAVVASQSRWLAQLTTLPTASAQQRQPAQLTTLPTSAPQEFDLLDNTGNWAPLGTIDPTAHQFTVTCPTQPAGTSSATCASTAFVEAAVGASSSLLASNNAWTGTNAYSAQATFGNLAGGGDAYASLMSGMVETTFYPNGTLGPIFGQRLERFNGGAPVGDSGTPVVAAIRGYNQVSASVTYNNDVGALGVTDNYSWYDQANGVFGGCNTYFGGRCWGGNFVAKELPTAFVAAAGQTVYDMAPAVGYVSFTSPTQPTSGQTITLNGTVVTFVTGTPTGNQVQIGTTLAQTIQNFVAFANASTDSNIVQANYSAYPPVIPTYLVVIYSAVPTGHSNPLGQGATFTLAASVTGATTSGPTLTLACLTQINSPFCFVQGTSLVNFNNGQIVLGTGYTETNCVSTLCESVTLATAATGGEPVYVARGAPRWGVVNEFDILGFPSPDNANVGTGNRGAIDTFCGNSDSSLFNGVVHCGFGMAFHTLLNATFDRAITFGSVNSGDTYNGTVGIVTSSAQFSQNAIQLGQALANGQNITWGRADHVFAIDMTATDTQMPSCVGSRYTDTSQVNTTSPIDFRMLACDGKSGGIVGTYSAHDMLLYAGGVETLRLVNGYHLVEFSNGASFVAATNCGSLSGSTGCLKIIDYNGNPVYLPVYGTL